MYVEAAAGGVPSKNLFINFLAKFTGKHLCWSLFFDKVTGLMPATFSKKRLRHRCISVNFASFLRIPFYGISPVAASDSK